MMARPIRLQLSREKGFGLQAVSRAANGLAAVVVTRPTKWGNPFTSKECRLVGFSGTDLEIATRCVDAFRVWLGPNWRENWDGPESERRRRALLNSMGELRGHNLACWCPLTNPDGSRCPCHADVLLMRGNAGDAAT